MSYILEALKRADAERQRGGVPGLHAQTGHGVTAAESGAAGGRPWALAVAALALLLIGGAVAWWWRAAPVALPVVVSGAPALSGVLPQVPVSAAPAGSLTGAGTAVPAPAAAPAAAVLPPPAVASNTAALAAPASIPLVQPAEAARPLPLPRPTPPSPTPAPAPALTTAAPRAVVAPGSASAAAVLASPTVPAAAPVAAVPERLLQLAELPDAVRREVGPLNPGGSIYAEQPAARMVILNGQVFREGDLLAAQLRVEQIRPRSVVLSLRGQRFELAL